MLVLELAVFKDDRQRNDMTVHSCITGVILLAAACGGAASPVAAGAQGGPDPLTFFVGDWSCVGRFADGNTIASRETFAPSLDGRWLEMHHVDDPPHRYKAIEMWRYDAAAKRLRVYVFDNSGGKREYTSTGWYRNRLELQNVATRGYVDRFTFQRRGDRQYRVIYAHRTENRRWKIGDTLDCTHQ